MLDESLRGLFSLHCVSIAPSAMHSQLLNLAIRFLMCQLIDSELSSPRALHTVSTSSCRGQGNVECFTTPGARNRRRNRIIT